MVTSEPPFLQVESGLVLPVHNTLCLLTPAFIHPLFHCLLNGSSKVFLPSFSWPLFLQIY